MRQLVRHASALTGLLLALCLVTSACSVVPQVHSVRTRSASPTPPPGPLGQLTRFPLPPGTPGLNRIAVGPDGSLWLTAFDAAPPSPSGGPPGGVVVDDAIVRFTPLAPGAPADAPPDATGTPSTPNATIPQRSAFTTFPLPTSDVSPDGITLGPDGALWFTEFWGDAVGRITAQGHITEFFVPSRPSRGIGSLPSSQPHDIVAGPDGNLWFADSGGNTIGRITPAGSLREFPLPSHPENPNGSDPYGVAVGSDGALWFTELTGMRIGRMTMDGRITEYKLPGVNHVPDGIVAGNDSALWFTEFTQNLLGRITVDGHITEYPLPHTQRPCNGSSTDGICQVAALVAGPDGAVWFTESWRNVLGRIDASGHVSEFPVPRLTRLDSGMPQSMVVAPDCTLWFTYGAGIGYIQPFASERGCSVRHLSATRLVTVT